MKSTLVLGPSRQLLAAICDFGKDVVSVRFEWPDLPIVQLNLHRSDVLLHAAFYGIVHPENLTEVAYRRIRTYVSQLQKLAGLFEKYEFSDSDTESFYERYRVTVGQWVKEGDL
jgi:hypothetical protein